MSEYQEVFLIEKNVFFRMDDMELSGNGKSISLTRTAGEVLYVLLKNGGEIVNRDMLLNSGFPVSNLPISGNSLNNHISTIRKAFLSLGIPNAIRTIHKLGFVVELQVEESRSAPSLSEETKSTKRNTLFYFSAMFILLLGIVFFYFQLENNNNEFMTLEKVGSCTFYYHPEVERIRAVHYLQKNKDFLEQLCSQDGVIIYDDLKAPGSDTKNEISITHCFAKKRKKGNYCESTLIFN